MGYLPLGPRTFPAAVKTDPTGHNPGNWTIPLDQSQIGIRVPWFECYHITLTNVPSATVVSVYLGAFFWDLAQLDTVGSWDPAQPLLMAPGQDLNLALNIPTSTVLPAGFGATAWFRFDPTLPNNPPSPA